MHNVTVLIQARVGSSRFPQKVLKKIEGKPMIWHVVNRVKQTNLVNQIALVTTKLDEDKKLLDIANELGVIGITGDENNVLKRFYDCASQINADPIIRITGDCPLIDPFLIDEMIKFFLEHDYDYISNRMIPTFPDGLDIEIFSYTALRSAILNSKLSSKDKTSYVMNDANLIIVGVLDSSLFSVRNFSKWISLSDSLEKTIGISSVFSIQLQFKKTGGTNVPSAFAINDISIIYRPKPITNAIVVVIGDGN